MKTLNKKILTTCLALMMTFVMAVPAFAASSYIISPDPAGVSSSNYLNLYGNSSTVLGRYVTLYNPAADKLAIGDDQIVNKINTTIDGFSGIYLTFRGATNCAINRHSISARAFMYSYPAGAYDSVVSSPDPQGSVHLLAGEHKGQHLGWASDSNFANVYFGSGGMNWHWGEYTKKD